MTPHADAPSSRAAGRPKPFPSAWRGVRVSTAAAARALDAAAIATGIPSRALMRAAGLAAASEITHRFAHRLSRGVAVFAGPGNNGGDAYVVAGALAAAGVRVTLHVVEPARTPDAQGEFAAADAWHLGAPHGGEEVIVDGVLGVGSRGAPTGAVADAIADINARRARGAAVVALDVPSGLDADTGAAPGACVQADLTLTFGTLKRGLLVARGRAGAIVVLDIGLGRTDGHAHRGDEVAMHAAALPALAEGRAVQALLPPMPADAHKGTRGKLLVVGGAPGMAGAIILAARAALAAGTGMVMVAAHPAVLPLVTAALPQALTAPWPDDDDAARALLAWADALVIGPGLGATGTRERVARLLTWGAHPVVLDADALNAFAGDAPALGALIGARPALVTPHPAEAARLLGADTADVVATRFEAGAGLARTLGAAVLLKGVPTVVTDPAGGVAIVARGTPALATGGSGDLLAGIAGAMLMHATHAADAGTAAAWLHGRAAEVAAQGRAPRGVSLDEVLVALPSLWEERPAPPRAPVLVELPAVREG